MVSPKVDDEPRIIKDALSSPDSNKWKMAMEEELNPMRDNHVWDWLIFHKEGKQLGTNGFNSVRVILAIVAHMDLELHQMDVKATFLNGDLSEEIYMTQLMGYVVKGQEQKGVVALVELLQVVSLKEVIKKLKTDKLESRSSKGRFVGYPEHYKGYYFYFPYNQRVLVSRDAIFLEKEFLQGRGIEKKIELEEVYSKAQIDPNEEVNPNVVGPHETHKSNRVSRPPERYGLVMEEIQEAFLYGDNGQDIDPINYKEAMSDIDSKKWLEAMQSEMKSMYSNQVWTLVDPLEGIVLIGCKWIYKRKIGLDGKVQTFKA
ncbi:uncharacterized protein LOC127807586 [Diospyros lotus]|uniref:uncharacterized protein LOC127807586 n=1 Tax=Diospyros lotus TaxID=55363 RepID=UPI002253F271|nr:uncharacterized protein LOC127807586 [Diospyros lotus]